MSLAKAKEFLELCEPQESINLLEPLVKEDQSNLEAIQLLGEAYLENGNPENAYQCLKLAVELDPQGIQGGPEKFLWLGQLEGDRPGLKWYEKGLEGLKNLNTKNNSEKELISQKIIQALCGMVEVWMTDLCMEPEAEANCDKLITEALLISDQIPEPWSILGSIRISQQRDEEAKQALEKSWTLYRAKSELGAEDLPALIRLAQNMIEMTMLDHVLDVTTAIIKIDDEIIDVHYLSGLAHFELYKNLDASMNSDNEPSYSRQMLRNIQYSKEALETVLQLASQDSEVDPQFVPAATEILTQIPTDLPEYESSEDEDEEWQGLED